MRSTPFIPITDSEYWGLVALSDENYVSLSRQGSDADLVQSIVDKIGPNRNIPVCVVSKEKQPTDKTGIFADKRSQVKRINDSNRKLKDWFGGKKDKQEKVGRRYIVIYDPSKHTPGQPFQRSGRKVDASFFEKHVPKYNIEMDFFESFPPKTPIEYITTQKDQTVVRCVLIRKTNDPYPLKTKPALTFVGENIEEPEEDRGNKEESSNNKPLRTYVLLRPQGYDQFEDFTIKKPLNKFE